MDNEVLKEIEQFRNKAFSAKLQGDHLIYFLKFAQYHKTTSISETIRLLIDQSRSYLTLDNEELKPNFFEAGKELSPFITEKISIAEVKKLKERHVPDYTESEEEENEEEVEEVEEKEIVEEIKQDNDNDEGVLTI